MFSSYCLVSCASVDLPAALDALKNNLQQTHKSTHLTLITFNQDGKLLHVDKDDLKSSPNGKSTLSMFMTPPPLIICVQFRSCLQSMWRGAIYGNC